MRYEKAVTTANQLAGTAGLQQKTGQLTSFLYMRALGATKQGIASELGMATRTLRRWEVKLTENLDAEQRHKLVAASVSKEFAERISGEQ